MKKNCSVDLFSEEYPERVLALKRPNTRIQIPERYNDRTDKIDLNEIVDDMIDLIYEMQAEKTSFVALGIDFEEKAFYDILKACAVKYGFTYPEDKTVFLAKEIKRLIGGKAKYANWSKKSQYSRRIANRFDRFIG